MAERAEQQQQEAALREETEAQATSTSSSMAQDQKKIYAQLVEDLMPMAAEWRALATQLNIEGWEQSLTAGQRNPAKDYLRGVIADWLNTEGPHTKAMLVAVLKRRSLRLNNLAARVSKDEEIPKDLDADKTESVKVLVNKLSEAAPKYSALGVQLLGSLDKVEEIEMRQRARDAQKCLNEVMRLWVDQEGAQLSHLLEAMRSKSIGNMSLAKRLEEEWKEQGLLPKPEDTEEMETEEPDIL